MVAGETVARLSNDGNVREEDFEPDAEYVRRAYDRAIDWYKVAENKAQLLLTVNGLLVTVFVGSLTGKTSGARPTGVETGSSFRLRHRSGRSGCLCRCWALVTAHHQYQGSFRKARSQSGQS
jgi:hypothetical protein